MDIALVTIAYNGYGEFIDQWLASIEASTVKPSQVVVALGHEHGCENPEELQEKYRDLPLQFHYTNAPALMGPMRNAAVDETNTEWVMYISVDDIILPDALEKLSAVENNADYICVSWLSEATWMDTGVQTYHKGKTPQELAEKHKCKGFIVGHSPFRRSFWQKTPYMDHDYPNAPFVAGLIENDARFISVDFPCTLYQRRLESHSKRLGMRRANRVKSEKKKAVYWKKHLERVMREKYVL